MAARESANAPYRGWTERMRANERNAGITAWPTRYASCTTGLNRGMPGTLPSTGSQSTRPAATMAMSRRPRARAEDDWACTSQVVIDPTSTTVTVAMATGGRWRRISSRSTGAGRVSHWMTS